MHFVGHTDEEGREQALEDHLNEVSALAGQFAEEFGAKSFGESIGLLHDIGKYSKEAQKRMRGEGPRVDHSTAGAQLMVEAFSYDMAAVGAYCIAGHHGGLPDGGDSCDLPEEGTLAGRLKRKGIPDYSLYKPYIMPKPLGRLSLRLLEKAGFSASFFTRMLFSCLVDADYLNTEAFMSQGEVKRGGYAEISLLQERLAAKIQPFFSPKTSLHAKRTEILKECIEKAEEPPGLYTLTVPTGGGKTIASLAFALYHAKKHRQRRVIYVIPYTSILEQTAEVFRDMLGEENVIVHYANAPYGDKPKEEEDRRRYATENWDAPVIVTTNVQFFESLFSNRTSKCRKLHNIVNSVVVLDEAQMLPTEYLLPCVRAIAELVHNYKVTAVLCSATQPALADLFPKEVRPTEICKDPEGLYAFFRRTTFCHLGELEDTALLDRLREHTQVLCIVNSRKHAQTLFAELPEGSFHLSTLMHPQHRRQTLKAIRNALKEGKPCRVVSTSLIEAGVDVDFPVVYRAEAGLDSQVQAGGRCNREGKRSPEESKVYIFRPAGISISRLPKSLSHPIDAARDTLVKHQDMASLPAIKHYFQTLYYLKGAGLDKQEIIPRLEAGIRYQSFPFARIASEFVLIENATKDVFIPAPGAEALFARLQNGERNREILREAALYKVAIYAADYSKLHQAGVIAPLHPMDTELFYLTDPSYYDEATGLQLLVEDGVGLFF